MTNKTNSFEGGSNGTAITAANSGGSSGTAFNLSDNTAKYSSTRAAHGTYSAFSDAFTTGDLTWNISGSGDIFGRLYIYTATFAAGGSFVTCTLANSHQFYISAPSGVQLDYFNGSTTSTVCVTGTAPAGGQWIRVEFKIGAGATANCEVRLYNTMDSGTATSTATGTVTQTASSWSSMEVYNGSIADIWLDDLGWSDVTWLGVAAGASQTVTLTGLASAEAFGTAQLNRTMTLTGIASAEAFGTMQVFLATAVDPDSIASAEAFGTAQLNLTAPVTGIASAEAFGTARVIHGTLQDVTLTGIASQEAFGDLVVSNRSMYVLRTPSIQETPAAWNWPLDRWGLHRGISIIRRSNGTYYTTRYPAQTEIEEMSATYLGGYEYPLTEARAAELTTAGYGSYIYLVPYYDH